MFYMGLVLMRAPRRQHAFGGNEVPDKILFQGAQDLLRRFCCAVPLFPAREWIMGHVSSRTR